MATRIGLAMQISANTAGIQRGVQRTEQLLGGLSKQARQSTAALRTLASLEIGKTIAGGIASIAASLANAAQSAVRYAGGLAQSIDQTAKLAERTGVAVEALQGFQVAASLSGVENLEGALQKVTIAIGNAAESGNTQAFANIGLDFAALQALSPEDQFRAISAAIAALPTEAERAAAAVRLFGRTGVELLPLFSSNLQEIEERAQRLGIVLSSDQTAAVEEMNDALDLVSQTFDGIIGQVTANLAPAITAVAEEFLTFVEGFQGIDGATGGGGIADAISESLLSGAEYLASVLDPWINTLVEWSNSFSSTASTIGGWFEYFQTAVELLQGVFLGARGIFNLFIVGFSEIVRYFVSYFSSRLAADIENFQQDLSGRITEDFNAAGQSFAGRRPTPETQAPGVLGRGVRTAREAFDGRNSPEAAAEREAKKQQRSFDRLNANFANAAADAAEIFGDEIPQGVAEAASRVQDLLTTAFEDGSISEEEAKAIAAAQAEYNAEIRDGKQTLDAAKKEEERRKKEEERRQQEIASLNERYAERAADIERDRLESLSQASNEALQGNDLRTSAGISQFLALATGREDPAVTEYRKQLKELQDIKREIAKANAAPVEIAGG